MLEPQSSFSLTTEKVKHQLIELLAWLEEPQCEGVMKLLIEDSDQCIELLTKLKDELQQRCLTNPLVAKDEYYT